MRLQQGYFLIPLKELVMSAASANSQTVSVLNSRCIMEFQPSGLLSTLVISLLAAFAGGLATRVAKLTPMLGYLIAGILIGPAATGIVADQSVASELAEVGVALLLFNVGLHFSFRDLMAVRHIVLRGAVIQMLLGGTLGFCVAYFVFGMEAVASVVLALSISVASTAISSHVLGEKQQLTSFVGRVAIGWLVVQDIAVVLAMVILPSFVGKNLDLGALFASSGKMVLQIAGFAAVMLFGAREYIPRMLGYVARVGSRELFTLAVIVIALGIAYGSAVFFGVSIALGAFFAGVVIGETDLNHYAAAEALSMQQIFSILFFVSAGMLFDPQSLFRMPIQIVVYYVILVLGMGFVTFATLVLMHAPPQSAALVGATFSQVGEFSFILSQMGYNWGILTRADSDFIVAVALLSIILNPAMSRIFIWLGKLSESSKIFLRWQKNGMGSMPEALQPMTGHVILVGHGRVGQRVAYALNKNSIPCITIESDRRLTENLHRNGIPVIFGDATRELVMAAAHPESAKLLIIATPQGGQVRQTITLARHLNPNLKIVVRVHEGTEARQVARMGIKCAVFAEREIAVGLSAFALQHYEVDPNGVLQTLKELRQE
ncbi:MAG: cation:proton antiporter [Alphaproteobacteria bacterium]|nr:cation:proton antiporter [Alphaproteobacteria bacterium]